MATKLNENTTYELTLPTSTDPADISVLSTNFTNINTRANDLTTKIQSTGDGLAVGVNNSGNLKASVSTGQFVYNNGAFYKASSPLSSGSSFSTAQSESKLTATRALNSLASDLATTNTLATTNQSNITTLTSRVDGISEVQNAFKVVVLKNISLSSSASSITINTSNGTTSQKAAVKNVTVDMVLTGYYISDLSKLASDITITTETESLTISYSVSSDVTLTIALAHSNVTT